MTPPPSLSRPTRTAGIALLGLAALALVIGGVTLLGGDGDRDGRAQSGPEGPGATGSPTPGDGRSPPGTDGRTGPPGAPTSPPSGPTGTAPGDAPGASPPGERDTEAGRGADDGQSGAGTDGDGRPGADRPGDGAPNGGAPGEGRPAGGEQQAGADRRAHSSVPLRVYNNSRISGLAADAAEDFRKQGWTVAAVDNYSSGRIRESTTYFRPGTAEEAAAKQLAYDFGMRAEPRFDGISDAEGGVIVIVAKDYEGAK